MKPLPYFFMLISLGWLSVAQADETPPVTTTAGERSPTQQWLELQRSGAAASTQAQPVSGAVMHRVHQRYLKSFEKPIPDIYTHEMPVTR